MNIGTLTITLGIDGSELVAANAAMNTFAKNTTTSLNTMSQRFRTFGYLASATITYPIVAAGKASIKMASDFEYSMQKIVGLAGVAQDSVTAWSNEILKMSPELAKRPQELAEALYFISSSGIKGAKAMDVLKISAKAATAGLGETQEVANLLTSALNAYAGTGLTASKAADILVAAVREGKAEADAFANSIGQIIPIASNLGVSFDQVAGGMAAITLTGASTSNAAVYLKGVFNSLVTASSQGEKALNKMGTSYGELRRVLAEQGLIALMQKLRDLQVKYGDELVGDVLPNIRAMTGFLSIAGKNFKYNTELMERVTNSAGSLGEAFAAVSDTLKVRMDRALAQANSSLITLGKSVAEAFIPILEWLVKKLDQVTQWFDSLTEAQKRHKLVVVAIVAALGPLALLFSVLGYGVSGLISLVTKLTRVWVLFNTQLTISKGITTIFASKLGWIGLAVTAVVGSIAFFAKKTKEAEEAQNGFNKATVTLNGSLTKLKELTTVDYSNMNFNQLFAVKTEALKAQKEASDNIQAALGRVGMSNEDFLAGKKVPLNQRKYVQTQVDAWNAATTSIKQVDTALDSMADQFGKTTMATESITEVVKTQTDAVTELGAAWKTVFDFLGMGSKEPALPSELFAGIKEATNGLVDLGAIVGQLKSTQPLSNVSTAHLNTSINMGDYSAFRKNIDNQLAKIDELDKAISTKIGKRGKDAYDANTKAIQVMSSAMNQLFSGEFIMGSEAWIANLLYILNLTDKYNKQQAEAAKKQEETLKIQDQLRFKYQLLANTMVDLGSLMGQALGGMELAWQDFAAILIRVVQQIINSLIALEIESIVAAAASGTSKEVEKSGFYGLITAAVGIAALLALIESTKSSAQSAAMAHGGIVPAGYPNDSYPARLTSGEVVIPPGKLDSITGMRNINITVDGKIKGKDLALALRRANSMN